MANLQLNKYQKANRTLHVLLHYTCETLMSAKQAIIDKLRGSVATCSYILKYGGVVNNQIKKGLLLSLRVNFFKSVNIWRSYRQKRDCLVHLCAWPAHC